MSQQGRFRSGSRGMSSGVSLLFCHIREADNKHFLCDEAEAQRRSLAPGCSPSPTPPACQMLMSSVPILKRIFALSTSQLIQSVLIFQRACITGAAYGENSGWCQGKRLQKKKGPKIKPHIPLHIVDNEGVCICRWWPRSGPARRIPPPLFPKTD